MKVSFYKQRRYKALFGVLAGLADKYDWDLGLTRALFIVLCFFTHSLAVLLYIVLALFLPYKEDLIEEAYGTGPRKRKEVRAVEEEDGWFW